MGKDRLIVECQRNGRFTIDWYLAEDQEVGGRLGQDEGDGLGQPPKERGDYEHWLGSKIARESKPQRDHSGFYWETQREADAVLRKIREAFKQDRPLPEWAKTALEHGWKAPKGWKA